jgi:hypothetical protein
MVSNRCSCFNSLNSHPMAAVEYRSVSTNKSTKCADFATRVFSVSTISFAILFSLSSLPSPQSSLALIQFISIHSKNDRNFSSLQFRSSLELGADKSETNFHGSSHFFQLFEEKQRFHFDRVCWLSDNGGRNVCDAVCFDNFSVSDKVENILFGSLFTQVKRDQREITFKLQFPR